MRRSALPLILLLLTAGILLSTQPAMAAYSNSVYHTILGSPDGNLTNYQVKLVFYNTTGTSSGEDCYLGSAIKSPYFYDLRINGTTGGWDNGHTLPMWVESYGANSAVVWVNITDTIPVSGQYTMKIYYGDPGISANPYNGTTTFKVFDQFNGDTLNTTTWGLCTGSAAAVSGGVVNITATASTTGIRGIYTNTLTGMGYAMRAAAKPSKVNSTSNEWVSIDFLDSVTANHLDGTLNFAQSGASQCVQVYTDANGSTSNYTSSAQAGVFQTVELRRGYTMTQVTINDDEEKRITTNVPPSTASYWRFVALRGNAGVNPWLVLDWVALRAFTDHEPTHSTYTSSAPSPTPTPTVTATPGPMTASIQQTVTVPTGSSTVTVPVLLGGAPSGTVVAVYSFLNGTALAGVNYTPNGTAVESSTIYESLSFPCGIAQGSDGDIWISDTHNDQIICQHADGTETTYTTTRPFGLSIDQETGYVYFAAGETTGYVGMINPTTGAVTQIKTGYHDPRNIWVNPSTHDIYFTDVTDNCIYKIPANLGAVTTVKSGTSSAWALTGDTAGNLYYVPGPDYHQLVKISPSGSTSNVGSDIIGSGGAVYCDEHGNIYVADAGNGVIWEYYASNDTYVELTNGIVSAGAVYADKYGNYWYTERIAYSSTAGDAHYVPRNSYTVTFAPGETSKNIIVPLLGGDGTFYVNLTSAVMSENTIVPITNPAATVNIGSAPIVPTATPWPTITVTPTPRPPTPTPIIGPPPTGKEYAYVANSKSGTVSIVDTSTDTVVGTIRVSDNPSGVVATPGGTYILVAGWNPNYVSVYNTLTHALVKTIAAGDVSPKYIDISADGEWAFALGKKGDYFYVQTIDMKTLTMTASVNITTTAGTHIEASDHGEYAIIACGDRIVRYNRVTGGVDECVIAPFIVYGMSEMGQNYNLFIIAGNGTLQYSPVTNSISEEHNFTYYDTPRSVAANVNEQKLYLVYFNTSYNVTKVDYWTGAIDWNVTLASPGYFMDTGADGVYVAESYNNTVVHIASNGTVLGYISVGAWPLDINIGNIIGVDSSMQYVTFTTRTLGDLLTVSQVNLTIYDNSNRLLYGTSTDDAGTATFYMSGVQQYRIHVNQSPNVDFDYNVMPSQTGYVIRISSADVAGNIFGWTSDTGTNAPETPGQPSGSAYTWSTSYNPEDGSADITVTYSRAAASVLFNLYRNATEFGGEDVLDDTATVNTPPFTHTFHIADATGRGYYVIMTVTGTPTGTTVISQGLAKVFPGPRVLTGVLPDDWFFWLGWGTILLLLTAGTVTKKGLFGVFGAVLGSIFTNWGWFSLVLNIDAVWYAIVGFCFIVSIGMMLGERERYT